jgi:multicomponent Na+:H+ antiporter subunit G
MLLVNVIVAIFLTTGMFFMFIGAIGLLRFPDFYTRLHATGKCDTLGEGLIIVGLIIYHLFHYSGTSLVTVKLLFLIIFIFIANPTAIHAIVKAAYRRGLKPWRWGEGRR